MGFDQAGFQCVFQVEWDRHCQSILQRHWAQVPKWSDVKQVNGAELPPCDILIFGSPCQDLSTAGNQKGLDGDRSAMFFEATRIIEEMRNATNNVYPRGVVWENVPGALTSNKGADFGTVLDTLAELGAVEIQWSILDAGYFGTPMRRRRVFVIAILDPDLGARCPTPLLPIQESSRWNDTQSQQTRESTATSVAGSTEQHTIDRQIFGESGFAQFVANRVAMLKASGGGGSENLIVEHTPAPSARKLTPTECERLMGWKDDHTKYTSEGKIQTDTQRYKQCGNGVVTPVAKWIATHLKQLLEPTKDQQ